MTLYATRLDQLRRPSCGRSRRRARYAHHDQPSPTPRALAAERQAIVELHRSGEIDDEVMRRHLREVDLEAVRLQS
jgi:hypothetical protein